MKEVMLDFETLGNGENKCLCQVGAVFFDSSTGVLGSEFKANIDAASHMRRGGVLDAPTVYWWLQQSDAARTSILAEPREDVFDVMTRLNLFLKPATRIWSHATFDFVTLMETLRKLGIKPEFSYKAGYDLRTLTYLGHVTADGFVRDGTHHDALEDCKYQVKYAVAALKSVKTNRQAINFLTKLAGEDK